jgi:hypothetical protein
MRHDIYPLAIPCGILLRSVYDWCVLDYSCHLHGSRTFPAIQKKVIIVNLVTATELIYIFAETIYVNDESVGGVPFEFKNGKLHFHKLVKESF